MPITRLEIEVFTGDDDLRPGSRAFVALTGRDSAGNPTDLRVVPLNRPGEKFADRSHKTVSADAGAIPVQNIEFVELRFEADRGLADDQWHCSRIRVTGNPGAPDATLLWAQDFSRDDRLKRSSPIRRSLRLSSSRNGPVQVEVEMTTGDDDLRSDSGGIFELEMADGRCLTQLFSGEFPANTTRLLRFDLPAGDPLQIHRARLFFGYSPLPYVPFESVDHLIWRALTTTDHWDLKRLTVRLSAGDSLAFDVAPGRLTRQSVWESRPLRPKVLQPLSSQEFLIEILTGGDDLRTSGDPHSEVAVSLVTRARRLEVPLLTRLRRDQPFVTPFGGNGVYVGSFESWGSARAVGRAPGGTPVALSDIERLHVRMDPEVTDHIIGSGIFDRGGDRWSLAGIRIFVPADGRSVSLRSRDTLRHLVSFFNLGVKLDKDRRTWGTPAFG